MAGIIIDSSVFGTAQAFDGSNTIVKINGIELKNGLKGVSSAGASREGSEWANALGDRVARVYTSGIITPRDPTLSFYATHAEVAKQIISPTGAWATTVFTLTIQLDAPSSALPGSASIFKLPTLTYALNNCLWMGETVAFETGGAAVMNEWTVRVGSYVSPKGVGV